MINKFRSVTYSNSTSKTHINASETIILSAKMQKILETLDDEVKNIVKSCKTDVKLLLSFVKSQGTNVYRLSFADKILSFINETEGFITPQSGFNALYLNFIIGIFCDKKLKLSFKSPEMFIFEDKNSDIYYLLHQFHLWYAYKKDLPGFDKKSQILFKKNLAGMSDSDVQKMSMDEILALKDAIARDAQAADFVIQLAKESSGAKKALEKIQKDGGAQI